MELHQSRKDTCTTAVLSGVVKKTSHLQSFQNLIYVEGIGAHTHTHTHTHTHSLSLSFSLSDSLTL